MKYCEACGREFTRSGWCAWTCPHCGYNTHPTAVGARSKASLLKELSDMGWSDLDAESILDAEDVVFHEAEVRHRREERERAKTVDSPIG